MVRRRWEFRLGEITVANQVTDNSGSIPVFDIRPEAVPAFMPPAGKGISGNGTRRGPEKYDFDDRGGGDVC